MSRWIITKNNGQTSFDTFEEAVNSFRASIKDYLDSSEGAIGEDAVPFDIDLFFSSKIFEGTISDEEIVIYERLKWLLHPLKLAVPHDSQDEFLARRLQKMAREDALAATVGDMEYHGTADWGGGAVEEVTVTKTGFGDEIVLKIVQKYVGDEHFLKTNAFIFDNSDKTYYFKSHWVVVASIGDSPSEEKLGEAAELNIFLKRVDAFLDDD